MGHLIGPYLARSQTSVQQTLRSPLPLWNSRSSVARFCRTALQAGKANEIKMTFRPAPGFVLEEHPGQSRISQAVGKSPRTFDVTNQVIDVLPVATRDSMEDSTDEGDD